MGLRYHKRINLGKGLGVNMGTGGVSISKRTKSGTIGSKGFSFKTGIQGLTYRSSWGKGNAGLVILAAIAIISVGWLIVYNVINIIILLIRKVYVFIRLKFDKDV